MTQSTIETITIPQSLGGQRIDLALQQMLPEHSRSRLQAWIKEGFVTVDGANVVAKTKVWGGEKVVVNQPPNLQENAFKPENIPLDIIYEDDAILVINKPAWFGCASGRRQLGRYVAQCTVISLSCCCRRSALRHCASLR